MSSVEVKEIGPCKQQFSIQVGSEEIEGAWSKNLQELSGTVALPGFRRGKVPPKVIEKRFSKEIESQVTQDLVVKHFEEGLKANNFQPLSDPKIEDVEFDRQKGLSFSATVEVRPQFELKDYKGIALEKPSFEITPDEIDKVVEDLKKSRAQLEKSETPAKEGDHLTGTAEFLVEGASVHTVEHAHLHAGHDHLHQMTLSGLGQKLIGLTADQETECAVELDDSFPVAEHQGKSATLKLKIEEVKVEKLPDMDEKFFKSFGVENEAELKERVEEDLKKTKEGEINEEISEKMLDKIAEPLNLPIPEDLLKRQSYNLLQQGDVPYRLAGAPKEEHEKIVKEELENIQQVARTQVRNFFILDQVAEKEKIFVTEKEMAQHIANMALSRGQAPEKLMEELKASSALSEIRLGIRERKTVEWLLKNADVTEVKGDVKKKTDQKSKKEKKTSA